MKTRLRVHLEETVRTEYWPVSGERAWLQEEQREEEPLRRGRPWGASLCAPPTPREASDKDVSSQQKDPVPDQLEQRRGLDMPVGFAMPVVTATTLDSRYKNRT